MRLGAVPGPCANVGDLATRHRRDLRIRPVWPDRVRGLCREPANLWPHSVVIARARMRRRVTSLETPPPARARIGERFSATLCSQPQPRSRFAFPPLNASQPSSQAFISGISNAGPIDTAGTSTTNWTEAMPLTPLPRQDSHTKDLRPIFLSGIRADHDRDQTTFAKVQRQGVASVAKVNYSV